MLNRTVTFGDLEFVHRFVWASRGRKPSKWHWEPVGLPRLSRDIELCTFYLFGLHQSNTGEVVGPGGTGAFVIRRSVAHPDLWHIYAVTNRHVVNRYSWIRINRDGKTRFIELDPSQWVASDIEDLCVADVTDELPMGGPNIFSFLDNFTAIREDHFLNHEFIKEHDVGIGDPTIMIGLFADHGGGERNTPVGKFGNIAAMADGMNPVRLHKGDNFVRPGYLNDMRSRTGFSGSPVWVYRTAADDLSFLPSDTMVKDGASLGYNFLRFLGIHRGQFKEPSKMLQEEAAVEYGDSILIPSSMALVIPAWEITRVLNSPTLSDQRNARDERADWIGLSNRIKALRSCEEASLG